MQYQTCQCFECSPTSFVHLSSLPDIDDCELYVQRGGASAAEPLVPPGAAEPAEAVAASRRVAAAGAGAAALAAGRALKSIDRV